MERTTHTAVLKVVKCSKPEEFEFAAKQATQLFWNCPLNFPAELMQQDPDGFHTGLLYHKEKLTYEVVSSCFGINYQNKAGYIGCYIVKEPLRGTGCGLPVFKAVLEHLRDARTVGLDAVQEHVPKYERSGFKVIGRTVRNSFTITAEHQTIPTVKDVQIEAISEANLAKILHYDQSVTGFDRAKLLKAFLISPTAQAFAAIGNGGVMGFACIKK